MKTIILFILVVLVLVTGCSPSSTTTSSTLNSEESTTTTTVTSTTVTSSTTEVPTVTTTTPTSSRPTSKMIKVDNILQNPELPTGCEVTSAAILLNYYGYSVDKLELVEYLPCSNNFYWSNGKLIGPDTNEYFCGDPSKTSGYGLQCFAPVIVKTLNEYLTSVDSKLRAKDLTGTSLDDLLSYISQDTPVIVWATIGMVQGQKKEDWYNDRGDKVTSYRNLHCMVLKGYDEGSVYLSDPLGTLTKVNKSVFESRYDYIGKQSIVLEDSE